MPAESSYPIRTLTHVLGNDVSGNVGRAATTGTGSVVQDVSPVITGPVSIGGASAGNPFEVHDAVFASLQGYCGAVTGAVAVSGVDVRIGSFSAHPVNFYYNAAVQGNFTDAAWTVNTQLQVANTIATPAGGSTAARLVFGTTSGFGIYYGSGAPTVSAAQGSIYIRSDGSSTATRLYVNTNGSTGWTNFTSAT